MTTEFTLGFKDMMSGGLQNLRATARDVFSGGIDKEIEGTNAKLTDLSKEVRLNMDSDGVKKAREDVDALHGSMGNLTERVRGLREVLEGTMLGGLAVEGIRRAIDKGREEVRDIFGSGMEAGMTKMELNVMAGDRNGQELYEGTKQFISNSMFGPELFGQDKLLLGYGEKAKNILRDIREEGDISMGDPMKMESLTEALGKTIMRGKFDMFEMRQLATTGFNPVQELSRKTGESTASLTEKMKEGRFTIQMYREAMDAATTSGGRFYEMQKKIMETPGGKWKQQTTNIAMAKEELGVALLPVVGRLVDALKPMVDGLPSFLDRMQPGMEAVVDGFREVLPSLREFGSGIFQLLKPVGRLLVSDEVKGLAKSVLSLSGDILHDLAPAMRMLAEGTRNATGALSWLVNRIHGEWDSMKQSVSYTDSWLKNNPVNNWLGGDSAHSAEERRIRDAVAGASGNFSFMGRTGFVPLSPQATMANMSRMHAEEEERKEKERQAAIMKESGDAIIGGGRKSINISFRNFAEHFTVQAGNMKEGVQQTEDWFKEMFLRLLNVVPA